MREGNKLDVISNWNRITAELEPIRIKRLRKQALTANRENMPGWGKNSLRVTIHKTLRSSQPFSFQFCDVYALLISYFTLYEVEEMLAIRQEVGPEMTDLLSSSIDRKSVV